MRRLLLAFLVCASAPALAQKPDKALEYYKAVQEFSKAIGDGRWHDAEEPGRKALAISGVDGDLWMQFGNALMRQQKFEQAIPAFEEALAKGAFENKQPAVACFDLASCNAHLGRKDEALKWLNAAYSKGFRDIRTFRNDEFKILKGYGNYDDMAAAKDLTGLSRNEGLAYDLWFLDRELRRIHYDPYRVTPKSELDADLAKLQADIPNITDEQFYVRARAYVVKFGDGHTALRLNDWKSPDLRTTPIAFTRFTDGVFVTSATEEYKQLLGRRLLAINDARTDVLMAKLAPLVSQDNIYGVYAQAPVLAGYASVLKGLGIAKGDGAKLTLMDSAGSATQIDVPFVDAPKTVPFFQGLAEKPLYLQHTGKTYWYTYLEGEKTVYMQYNAVRSDADEPIPAFMERMFKELEGKPIDKFVVDVRFNGGGNSFLNSGIQRPLMRNPEINKKGRLFIITGRNTFSAAQNFTTDFVRDSEAIFVGEPTGSRPNFVGETVPVVLPYTKMRATVSDLYWERSWPMDHRTWIPPDLPTEMSSADYFAGRDPAMEAVLAFGKGG